MPYYACRWCDEVARFDDDPQGRCPQCLRTAGWSRLDSCTCPTDAQGDLIPRPGCELHWRQVIRSDPPTGQHP